jgi:hypothetical protein
MAFGARAGLDRKAIYRAVSFEHRSWIHNAQPTGLPDRGVSLGVGCWLITARHRTDRPSCAQGMPKEILSVCEMSILERLRE